jgi:hypothetical protein
MKCPVFRAQIVGALGCLMSWEDARLAPVLSRDVDAASLHKVPGKADP